MKKELNILIACVGLWCSGVIAAPMLSGTMISDVLYRFYSVVCHQFSTRSFHLYGEPIAVCIRCTSIYIGFLTALIVLRFSDRLRAKNFNSVHTIVIVFLPMAIDGIFSLLNIHDSSTLSRIATGVLFGSGMAMVLFRTLTEIIHSIIRKRRYFYGIESR